jgi:hypothetical protein
MTDWRAPTHPFADYVIQLRLPAPSDAAALHRYALAEGGLEGVWLPLAFGADAPKCTTVIEDWLAGWRNVSPSRPFTLAGTVVSHVPATGATYEDLRYTLSRPVVTV